MKAIIAVTDPFMNLDVVEDTSPKTVGGITVKMELERMWKEEVLAKKSKELEGEENVRIKMNVNVNPP